MNFAEGENSEKETIVFFDIKDIYKYSRDFASYLLGYTVNKGEEK